MMQLLYWLIEFIPNFFFN